jgi:predicted DNA-binding transcriptional regulator AlpA
MRLSLLSILLGLGMSVPQIYGLTKPVQFAAAARKFPRNLPVGVMLMLLATAWFVWNVNVEPVADFSVFKPYMMAGFAAVGILACIFVQDFLAVRGLAAVLLLLAKLMVDTGRRHLGESPFVQVIEIWAYLLVIAGVWFTVTPWKLRDILNWATATEDRIRIGCAIRLAFAVFVMLLGLTAFRAM